MRLAVVALVALLVVVPAPAQAQTLRDTLAAFHFELLRFSFTWNKETDAANVIADARDLKIEGDAARDLRHCIDGSDCQVPELTYAAHGNGDGRVSHDEVDDFTDSVIIGLSAYGPTKDYLRGLRGLIQVDGKDATSVQIRDLVIDSATGSADSRDTVRLHMAATAHYGTVVPAETHALRMLRYNTNFTISDRVEVRGADGWNIQQDTIQPSSMDQFYSKGKISGTQEEFESTEPLTFTVDYHPDRTGTYFLWGSLAIVAIAAGALGFVWYRRHKV